MASLIRNIINHINFEEYFNFNYYKNSIINYNLNYYNNFEIAFIINYQSNLPLVFINIFDFKNLLNSLAKKNIIINFKYFQLFFLLSNLIKV